MSEKKADKGTALRKTIGTLTLRVGRRINTHNSVETNVILNSALSLLNQAMLIADNNATMATKLMNHARRLANIRD